MLWGWIIFPLGPALVYWLFLPAAPSPTTPLVEKTYLRGTSLLDMEQAYDECTSLPTHPSEPRITWGGLPLPERYSSGHFLLLGSTQSGKTVSLRLLMQSILPYIRSGSDWRALVYDPKNEFRSILSGMPIACPLVSMNPFDTRGVAWDIAKDIAEPNIAEAVARILIERQGSSEDATFWTHAAQNLTGAVMTALVLQAPRCWTLRDVVLTLSRIDRMRRLLRSTSQTKLDYDNHFEAHEQHSEGDRTVEGIKHTIAANMARLKPIAGAWADASTMISLAGWSRESYILHLGRDADYPALDAVNRVLFHRLSQLLVKGEQLSRRRCWVFIDEAQFAGNLEGLPDLLTTGSSFGVRVCLATQDIPGFRSVYPNQKADSILGQCANKAFLRTSSRVTAEYAAGVIGSTEQLETTRSESSSETIQGGLHSSKSNSFTKSTNVQVQSRLAVMAEEIQYLEPASPDGFFGFYQSPPIGSYCGWVYQKERLFPRGRARNFIERPARESHLHDWTLHDEERLGRDLLRILKPSLYEDSAQSVTQKQGDKPRRTHLDDAYVPPPGTLG